MSKELSYKSHVDRQQVIGYLRDLAQSLEDGVAYVKHGSNVVALHPSDAIEIEVDVSEKKSKQKLSFELCWRAFDDSKQEDFEISATEPITETEAAKVEDVEAEPPAADDAVDAEAKVDAGTKRPTASEAKPGSGPGPVVAAGLAAGNPLRASSDQRQ